MKGVLEAKDAFREQLIDALCELLGEYRGRLDHWAEAACPEISEHDRVAGIVGFAADQFVGSIAIMAAPSAIASLLPEALVAVASDESVIEDWVGELSNQLLGRAKNKLAAMGLSFKLATPTVVGGSRLRLVQAESNASEWMCVDSSSGRLYVMLEFRGNVDFEWAEDIGRRNAAAEGEVRLF